MPGHNPNPIVTASHNVRATVATFVGYWLFAPLQARLSAARDITISKLKSSFYWYADGGWLKRNEIPMGGNLPS